MSVFLDVHVASSDQQSAVACSITSSHEFLQDVASISSRADPNSQSVFPSTVSQGMDLCLEFRSTTTVHSYNKFLQQILITGSQTVPSTPIQKYGQIHHNPRINFGIHHEVLHQFGHPSRRSEPILRSSRRSEPILHPP